VDKKLYLSARRQTTTNYKQTQKIGQNFACYLSSPRKRGSRIGAMVLGLKGNLGSGKTTFLQGFAKGLGIKEKILSPTFIIMKRFVIPAKAGIHFFHLDCYRFKNEKDILDLGFKEIISNPKNIVAIEWPKKIKKLLPKNTIYIDFKFINQNKREIIFRM
jgi:tRNA threonylcarbamoyladenosine biosynthesis protein TsaE